MSYSVPRHHEAGNLGPSTKLFKTPASKRLVRIRQLGRRLFLCIVLSALMT